MLSSSKVVKALFGLAVAGALGFGATGATASVGAAADCSRFATDEGYIGTCTSGAACSSACLAAFPANGGISNNCASGCCVCMT
jgi:hypothetical protein